MRKGRARLLGVLALIVGVVGALALWWLADKRYDDAVADLAPAPIGCDTTLVFDRTGTYTFFVETAGSVGEIDGDCETDDREYDLGDDDVPDVDLVLLDAGGDEIDLDQVSGPSYDSDGTKGTGVQAADIEDTGDYVLTASSDDPEVMIRVGRDPSSGVAAMRIGAVAVLVAGIALFLLALTRRRPPARRRGRSARVRPVATDAADGATDRSALRQPAGLAALRSSASAATAGPSGLPVAWPPPSPGATRSNGLVPVTGTRP